MLTSKDEWFTDEIARNLGYEISQRLQGQFATRTKNPSLRLSQMGPRCPKALWASIHAPESAETLPAHAHVKFSFGHTIEALAISLAKSAGHTVTGEQDVLEVDGVEGHRDCVIDGCIVDVKSAASRSFSKFKDGSLKETDYFGYLDQLDGYLVGSLDDPLVTVKDRAYLWAVDKQLGHMCLYEHRIRPQRIRDRIKLYKDIIALPEPPACECGVVPDGKSGNLKLDVKGSYSPYKYFCNPRLRCFLYSSGPVFLTHVVRQPDVPEIDRHGKLVTFH
jgi:hypothetical protein